MIINKPNEDIYLLLINIYTLYLNTYIQDDF